MGTQDIIATGSLHVDHREETGIMLDKFHFSIFYGEYNVVSDMKNIMG